MTVEWQKKSLQENWFETIFRSRGNVAKALSYLKDMSCQKCRTPRNTESKFIFMETFWLKVEPYRDFQW